MQELLLKIQGDTTLMLMAIMAFVVLLVIVLVIVVSAMRVKTYKDRFWNTQVDNKEKAEHIAALEKELQEYKIKHASDQQVLQQFDETKDALMSTNGSFLLLQSKHNELEKELSQVKAKLEGSEDMHNRLHSEHKDLKDQHSSVQESNSKFRINNARLLTKLESEKARTEQY